MERKILGINASVVLTAASGRVMWSLLTVRSKELQSFVAHEIITGKEVFVKQYNRTAVTRDYHGAVSSGGVTVVLRLVIFGSAYA